MVLPLGVNVADDTDELGGAVFHPVHRFEELFVILLIVAGLPRVPGGVDPGRAGERVDAEAGIVRQRGAPGQVVDGFGLQEGVFLEGGAVFLHFNRNALFLLGIEGVAQRLQHPAEFLHLMGVVGG